MCTASDSVTRKTASTTIPRDGKIGPTVPPRDLRSTHADKPLPRNEQRHRLHDRADPFVPTAGVHRERSADRTGDAHSELQTREPRLECVLNHGAENDSGARAQLLALDRVTLEALAQDEYSTLVTRVGDQDVAALAQYRPLDALFGEDGRGACEVGDGIALQQDSAAGPPMRKVVWRVMGSRTRTAPLIDSRSRETASVTDTVGRPNHRVSRARAPTQVPPPSRRPHPW